MGSWHPKRSRRDPKIQAVDFLHTIQEFQEKTLHANLRIERRVRKLNPGGTALKPSK
jgi:hypothetical protein